jgi:hypothetical protein
LYSKAFVFNHLQTVVIFFYKKEDTNLNDQDNKLIGEYIGDSIVESQSNGVLSALPPK